LEAQAVDTSGIGQEKAATLGVSGAA